MSATGPRVTASTRCARPRSRWIDLAALVAARHLTSASLRRATDRVVWLAPYPSSRRNGGARRPGDYDEELESMSWRR